MRIVTVTNQKGGVGKTTLVCHLALAGVERGLRTLVVDLDTQGNASTMLARDAALARQPGGSAALFSGGEPAPTSTATGVDLLHGHQRLDEVDQRVRLADAAGIRARLRALPYDVVVIDTPPAIGLRHLGPQVWADLVVTPLEPNSFSLLALGQTLSAIEEIRAIRPGLENRVLINRFNRSSGRQNRYIELLSEHVPLTMPFLTLRVAVSDALDEGLPVWRFRRADRETRETWKRLCEDLIHV
jgi:chromosome partitioning protein